MNLMTLQCLRQLTKMNPFIEIMNSTQVNQKLITKLQKKEERKLKKNDFFVSAWVLDNRTREETFFFQIFLLKL